MQVEKTLSENLKRAYNVTVGADAVATHVEKRLEQIAKTMKVPGFRPGKVPLKVVRQNYGKNILGEVLETVLEQSSHDALKQHGETPAMRPKIEVLNFKEGEDLKYKMEFEVFPEVPELDISKLTVERPKAKVSEADIAEALERVAENFKDFEEVKSPRAAKKGDAVKIDFKGFIGDKAFPGGEAAGHRLELGSGQFIEGFEDQLIGSKPGDKKTVNVTFPSDYGSKDLAGKPATFEVTVHEVLERVKSDTDDKLAEKLGFDSLDKLKDALKSQIEREAGEACRAIGKKSLFDLLDTSCKFTVPEAMVEGEFQSVWQQVEQAKKRNPKAEEYNKPEEALKKEYRAMAERRVRLGILLAEIGKRNELSVSQDEMNQALMEELRRYPGQEQQILEYYKNNPMAVQALKGPVLEEKVVDFIFSKVKLKEPELSLEELREREGEEGGHIHDEHCGHDHDHGHVHDENCNHDHDGKKAAKKSKK